MSHNDNGHFLILIQLNDKIGETTVLIGPSGCGKSTLIRLIVGLIASDSGQIFIEGEEFFHLKKVLRAKKTVDFSWTPPGLVVVGPPGDITESERELFLHNNFSSVNINDCILKTETAALSIAAIVKNLGQEGSA